MVNSNRGMTHYLERPGGRIAYEVAGPATGQLVVCIPGMGDVRSTFGHLSRQLVDAGFRVACMDLRGHGDSAATFDAYDDDATATDALALIHQLGAPAVVVGNSMGAAAAVLAAAHQPDVVASLVLIAPFVRPVPSPVLARWALRVAMAGPWSTRVWLSYLPALYPSRRGAEFESHRSEIAAAMRRPGRAAAFRRTTRTDHTPAWNAAQQLEVPALVVMGTQDPDFPDPAAEAHLIATTLGAQVVMATGAGHYPQQEFPEITGPAVVDYLTQQAPRG